MTRSEAEDFLYAKARLLDEQRWREWQQLFTEDALYWIPSNDIDADPEEHIAFVYDDMELLDERLRRLESGACHAQIPPSSTLHQIGNVSVEQAGDDQARVRSNLVLYEFKTNSQVRLRPLNAFPAHCEHHLRRVDGEWRIAYKKVGLLNCDGEITNLTFLI